jgi:hypothetical protein
MPYYLPQTSYTAKTLSERKIRNNINYFKALHPCRAREKKELKKKKILAL